MNGFIQAMEVLLRNLEKEYPAVLLRCYHRDGKYHVKVVDKLDATTELTTISNISDYIVGEELKKYLQGLDW